MSPTVLYIIHNLGDNEVWVTIINGISFVASLVMPIVWDSAQKNSSLMLARITIAISVILNIVFSYLRTLELQIVRAFISGAGRYGVWMSLFTYIIRNIDSDQRIQQSSIIFLIRSVAPTIAMNIGGIIVETT